MNVRSFRLSDYAPVKDLLQEVLSESCYEETIEAFARQLSWDSELVLIAEVDREVAGIVIGTIDNNNGYYYRIAVGSGHQRKGIGTSLIQAMKTRFQNRKVSKIWIAADQHNEPILPLYESLGYRSVDFFRSFKNLSIITG